MIYMWPASPERILKSFLAGMAKHGIYVLNEAVQTTLLVEYCAADL